MLAARSLAEIQALFISALERSNSPLNDLTPGSVLNSLARAVSIVQLEQDLRLSEAERRQDLLSASGADLDLLARNYGIQRVQGQQARGRVLAAVRSNIAVTSVNLEPGTILTEPTTGFQYIVNIDDVIRLSVFTLTSVPVVAAQVGSDYNLPSGTRLVLTESTGAITQLSVDFYVGTERTADGTFCGEISNGVAPEQEESLRLRIIERRRSQSGNSPSEIRTQLLQAGLVEDAWVRTKGCGLAEVLVRSKQDLSGGQIQELKQQIAPFLPLGVIVAVGNVRSQLIDLSIEITPFAETPLQDLDNRIKTLIQMYFQELDLGESFFPDQLLAMLRPLGQRVVLLNPTQTISTGEYQILQLNRLSLTYAT